ncbi:MAG: SET domain-containing protein-lysine N-methyltransferase [Chitinophagaceae bacterium]|nr:SET domain-containing protein-lysine N-methyltransferase [Chitinophagaceae bacterium]
MILSCLFTAKTEARGWGVFTKKAIRKGTTLEVSPVVVMTQNEKELLDETRLHDYIFHWEGDQCCMALGLISVYNHSYTSNADYLQDFEQGVIEIVAVRDIQAGEEICINYNGEWDDPKPVWFEVMEP